MISIGDLVQCRYDGQKMGIVVDKKLANENLMSSVHAHHLTNVYDYLYYVYTEEGRSGPYYTDEIILKQALLRS